MELWVQLRVADRVSVAQPLAHVDQHVPQLSDVARSRLRGRLARQQAFEGGADFLDLERFLVRNETHARAAIVLARHQPLLVEPDERGANGGAAGAEPPGPGRVD